MEKLEKKESLNRQEDLLILEKERNLDLGKQLAKEKGKYEELVKKLELANSSFADLKSSNDTLQERFVSLENDYRTLEVNYDALWKSFSSSNDVSSATNPSTSQGCARCFNVDVNACVGYTKEREELVNENDKLKNVIKEGLENFSGTKCLVDILHNSSHLPSKKGVGHKTSKGKNKKEVAHIKNKKKVENNKSTNKGAHVLTSHTSMNASLSNSYARPSSSITHAYRVRYTSSYVLKKDHHGKIVANFVGDHKKGTPFLSSIWVPKAVVANLKGPIQKWVPKIKT